MRELTEREVAPLWDKLAERLIPIAVWRHQESEGKAIEIAFANAILSTFGAVSELETREKERKAYACGWFDAHKVTPLNEAEALLPEGRALRDKAYPPLTLTPRAVELSNGELWGRAIVTNVYAWTRANVSYLDARPMPPCVTADDFEKCAALLREEQGR